MAKSRPSAADPAETAAHLRAVLAPETGAPTDDPWDATAQTIAVRAIDTHGDNVRRHMDPVELAQLTDSLKRYGMLEPVLVQPIPGRKAGHRYRLVAGYRRMAAAKALGWDTVPARVLGRPLTAQERVAVQLTENLQREAMRLRDLVASIEALQEAGQSVAQIADTLGLGVSTVRLYAQLGDLLTRYPKLWPYFDRGLISIEHFRAATRLLTRIRERAGQTVRDPGQLELVRAEAEQLFVQLLEQLAQIQPLTVKRVSQEVARWLAQIGVEEPPPPPKPPAAWKPTLAALARLDWTALSAPELEEAITITEAALDAAKSRLADLAGA